MKRIVLFLFILFATTTFASQTNTILQKSLKAVVGVYSIAKNGEVLPVGSGVIVKSNGLVVTNYHVVKNQKEFVILLSNGESYNADLLISESDLDLALLQINNLEEELTFLDTKPVQYAIGDDVYAIGNPRNVGISVTSGIISALPSKNSMFGFGNLIQTDAAINPGSSGGALIDSNGNLIGLNTFIVSNTSGFTGIGFAVPVKVINLFVSRFLSGKKIRQYWVGIGGVNLDGITAKKYGLRIPTGVLVAKIYANSPAVMAGLQVNDIVLKFDEARISSMSDLLFMVASLEEQKQVKLTVLRDGKEITLFLLPEKTEEASADDKLSFSSGVLNGVTIANNSTGVAYYLNTATSNGVVVYEIDENSYLAKLGLKKGDFISVINNIKVENINEVKDIMINNKNAKEFKFTLIRGNTTIEIAVTSSKGFN